MQLRLAPLDVCRGGGEIIGAEPRDRVAIMLALPPRIGAARYPTLRVGGNRTPPFRPLTPEEDEAAIACINAAAPEIVWVGLSTPKQEFWIASHFGRLNAPVLVGVGAAFDFLAGTKPQAPVWMQQSGLEWAYRLAREPRRLWKRYGRVVPLFIFLALTQLISQRMTGKDRVAVRQHR
jgi:N-acetylglucosaminyldiphosphoundecaprenol N-acetyl-beta-D-mannosaminyltransferase